MGGTFAFPLMEWKIGRVIVHNEPLNEKKKCGFTELVMKRIKGSMVWHQTSFQKRVDEPDLAHPMATLTMVPFQFALTCLGVAKFAELVYTKDQILASLQTLVSANALRFPWEGSKEARKAKLRKQVTFPPDKQVMFS